MIRREQIRKVFVYLAGYPLMNILRYNFHRVSLSFLIVLRCNFALVSVSHQTLFDYSFLNLFANHRIEFGRPFPPLDEKGIMDDCLSTPVCLQQFSKNRRTSNNFSMFIDAKILN